jgi:hypothetical protein
MRPHADSGTSAFVLCDPAAEPVADRAVDPAVDPAADRAVGFSSPIAPFSQVASRTEPGRAPRSPAPPLEGTAVSTTPSSDIRPEGARL